MNIRWNRKKNRYALTFRDRMNRYIAKWVLSKDLDTHTHTHIYYAKWMDFCLAVLFFAAEALIATLL